MLLILLLKNENHNFHSKLINFFRHKKIKLYGKTRREGAVRRLSAYDPPTTRLPPGDGMGAGRTTRLRPTYDPPTARGPGMRRAD